MSNSSARRERIRTIAHTIGQLSEELQRLVQAEFHVAGATATATHAVEHLFDEMTPELDRALAEAEAHEPRRPLPPQKRAAAAAVHKKPKLAEPFDYYGPGGGAVAKRTAPSAPRPYARAPFQSSSASHGPKKRPFAGGPMRSSSSSSSSSYKADYVAPYINERDTAGRDGAARGRDTERK